MLLEGPSELREGMDNPGAGTESSQASPSPLHYRVEKRKLHSFENRQALTQSSFSRLATSQHLHAGAASAARPATHSQGPRLGK